MQKKLARQKKGSRGWYATRHLIRREYERLANKRKDKANKVYHDITKGRSLIVMQDENIKGWHKGLFGKQVQNSALGTLKSKLKANENVIVIDSFFPSTKMCPECGTIKEDLILKMCPECGTIKEDITLSDRTFICGSCGYTEDRDIKAAKTMLLAGRHQLACTCMERTRTLTGADVRRDKSHETVMLSAVMAEASILWDGGSSHCSCTRCCRRGGKEMKKDLSYYMSLPYRIEIIKDPDENGYVAFIPELKGCITTGLTEEDALENLKDAKETWLSSAIDNEGPIPEPDITKEYSGEFKLRMPKSLHRILMLNAREEGVSMNQYCVMLLSMSTALRQDTLKSNIYK